MFIILICFRIFVLSQVIQANTELQVTSKTVNQVITPEQLDILIEAYNKATSGSEEKTIPHFRCVRHDCKTNTWCLLPESSEKGECQSRAYDKKRKRWFYYKGCTTVNSEIPWCSHKMEFNHLNREAKSDCFVDGQWGKWRDWSECSVSCGEGTKRRSRLCDNPSPEYGGSSCQGNGTESRSCKDKDCPIDGNWSTWSEWSHCYQTCGREMRFKHRECNNPSPKNCGKTCAGNKTKQFVCKIPPCPVDGGFTNWTNWTVCSRTCDQGQRTRRHSCTNPPPKYGGKCHGNLTMLHSCNLGACSVAAFLQSHHKSIVFMIALSMLCLFLTIIGINLLIGERKRRKKAAKEDHNESLNFYPDSLNDS